MDTTTAQRRRIELTDGLSISIVEHYQRQIGDKTAGRTLTRIVQAFHAAGMTLSPPGEDEAETLSRRAAGEPAPEPT